MMVSVGVDGDRAGRQRDRIGVGRHADSGLGAGAELHQPRLEHERRPFDPAGQVWVRVERQTLKRLTATATVFGIHTYLVPLEKLSPEQLAGLPDNVRRGGSMGETN